MTLRIAQTSRPEGKDWWNWSVWIEGTPKELDTVDHVTYTLHPTFAHPVRRVKTRRNKFRLDSAGWGEFEIFAEIVRTDGTALKRKHWLELASSVGAPSGSHDAAAGERVPAAYISAGPTDAATARKVAEALSAEGIRVLSASPPGLPEDKATELSIKGADIVVFLLSSRPTLRTYRDIEYALAHKVRHIVPVIIGASVELPPRLESMRAIRVASGQELQAKVGELVRLALGKRKR